MMIELYVQNNTLFSKQTSDSGSIIIISQGFPLKLVASVNQNNIPGDGSVTVTITAEIFDYLDAPQTNDTRNVTFELGGQTDVVVAVNGVASTTFTPGVPGTSVFNIMADGCNSAQIEVIAV